jgi:hypothetical protein
VLFGRRFRRRARGDAVAHDLGRTRHAEHPLDLPIPYVQDAFDDSGRAKQPIFERRVGWFLDELEWYTEALRRGREHGTPY